MNKTCEFCGCAIEYNLCDYCGKWKEVKNEKYFGENDKRVQTLHEIKLSSKINV